MKSEGQRYLVVELADRGSLDTRIEKQGRLSRTGCAGYRLQNGPGALDMPALKHNFLHRDIKPGNILFDADHEPKLIDFGLARGVDFEPESLTETHGTPYYVAPEKFSARRKRFLSDMCSGLGCTLYSAPSPGHVPFDAPTVEAVVAAHVQHSIDTASDTDVVPEITRRRWRCAFKGVSSPRNRRIGFSATY